MFKLEKNKENAGMFRRDSESSSDVHNGFWKDFFVSNGINPLDITSHGIRKLAKSYASTGQWQILTLMLSKYGCAMLVLKLQKHLVGWQESGELIPTGWPSLISILVG